MVCCNLSITFGIARSSPFLMGVCGMLTVPISCVVDRLLHGYVPSTYTILGSVCVIAGFVMLQYPQFRRLCTDDRVETTICEPVHSSALHHKLVPSKVEDACAPRRM